MLRCVVHGVVRVAGVTAADGAGGWWGLQVRTLLESESKVREKEQELRQHEAELGKQELRLQSAQAQLEQDRNAHIAALESWAKEMRERELKEQEEARALKAP